MCVFSFLSSCRALSHWLYWQHTCEWIVWFYFKVCAVGREQHLVVYSLYSVLNKISSKNAGKSTDIWGVFVYGKHSTALKNAAVAAWGEEIPYIPPLLPLVHTEIHSCHYSIHTHWIIKAVYNNPEQYFTHSSFSSSSPQYLLSVPLQFFHVSFPLLSSASLHPHLSSTFTNYAPLPADHLSLLLFKLLLFWDNNQAILCNRSRIKAERGTLRSGRASSPILLRIS